MQARATAARGIPSRNPACAPSTKPARTASPISVGSRRSSSRGAQQGRIHRRRAAHVGVDDRAERGDTHRAAQRTEKGHRRGGHAEIGGRHRVLRNQDHDLVGQPDPGTENAHIAADLGRGGVAVQPGEQHERAAAARLLEASRNGGSGRRR